MKKLFAILVFTQTMAFGQIECYTALEYESIEIIGDDVTVKPMKGQIGMCYSPSYFSINLQGDIKVFPVMQESIDKRTTSEGFMVYTFFNESTFLNSRGQWNIEIVYEKHRKVVLNNTISGEVYVMTFKDSKYHQMKLKTNVDSLGKLLSESSKQKEFIKKYPPCKYCDGYLSTFGDKTYCGRCKKDTTGIDYRLNGANVHYECKFCLYKANYKDWRPVRCPNCDKDSLGNKQ